MASSAVVYPDGAERTFPISPFVYEIIMTNNVVQNTAAGSLIL